MISVIIPLFNKEKSIAASLQSVLNQTFQNFEIVIINDGSTDGSLAELEKINDSRIHIFHQSNVGVSAARNRGIDEAHSNLIAFLDADDEWKPAYLQTQYELFRKYPECSIFACNYEFRNSCGEITSTTIRRLPFKERDGILTNYFEVGSYSHPPIWTSAIMVKKEAIQSVSGFPLGIKSGEDLLTWARLACLYKVAYSTSALSYFNVEGYKNSDTPKRFPDERNYVGIAFEELFRKYKPTGMRHYIAHWYKMRASIYMRLNMRTECVKESLKSLRFSPWQPKVLAYLILLFISYKKRKTLLSRI